MKKTLSLVLAMLMLLSVFTVTSVAAKAPEMSEITSTFDGVVLTWESVGKGTTYLVYRDDVCIGTTVDCKFVDVNVENNTTYNYSVAAQAKDGSYASAESVFDYTYVRPHCDHEGAEYIIDIPATVYQDGAKHKYCKICGFTGRSKPIKQLVPEAPVINLLSNRVEGVTIAWNIVDGATCYHLYRRTAGKTTWEGPIILKNPEYVDKTASSGTFYKYAVRAINAAGASEYIGGKVIKRVATPKNLYAGNTVGGIFFRWNPVKNATHYNVYRTNIADGTISYIDSVTTTYYADLKVEAGVDYIYSVRAISNGVYSAYAPGIEIRRLEAPKLLSATSTEEGMLVDFEPVVGATGYHVYRKTTNGPWSTNAYLGLIDNTRSHAYLDRHAKKGVNYTYTVKAYSISNSTEFSEGAYSDGAYYPAGISGTY